jgi:hypothetical protein
MRNLLGSCRQPVGKLWQVCVQMRALSPHPTLYMTTVWVSSRVYPRVLRRFITPFSTSFSYNLSLFSSYLYLFSTQPTNVTTNFLNFKSLVIIKELA